MLGCFRVPLILIGVGRLPTPEILGARLRLEVDRLRLEVDIAVAADQRFPGIDEQGPRGDEALAQVEVSDQAFDVRPVRHAQGGQDGLAKLQAREVDQERAEIAAGHVDIEAAIAVTEEGRDRIAGRIDLRPTADCARAMEGVGSRP